MPVYSFFFNVVLKMFLVQLFFEAKENLFSGYKNPLTCLYLILCSKKDIHPGDGLKHHRGLEKAKEICEEAGLNLKKGYSRVTCLKASR